MDENQVRQIVRDEMEQSSYRFFGKPLTAIKDYFIRNIV